MWVVGLPIYCTIPHSVYRQNRNRIDNIHNNQKIYRIQLTTSYIMRNNNAPLNELPPRLPQFRAANYNICSVCGAVICVIGTQKKDEREIFSYYRDSNCLDFNRESRLWINYSNALSHSIPTLDCRQFVSTFELRCNCGTISFCSLFEWMVFRRNALSNGFHIYQMHLTHSMTQFFPQHI